MFGIFNVDFAVIICRVGSGEVCVNGISGVYVGVLGPVLVDRRNGNDASGKRNCRRKNGKRHWPDK